MRQKYYSVSEMSWEMTISKRKLWVVETAGNLLGSSTFAAAVAVETLQGKKGLAVECLMELSLSQLYVL